MIMKKKWIVALGWLMGLVLLGVGSGAAQPVAATNSAWVADHAEVLSHKTVTQIDRLNDQTFKQLTGQPQLAVVTLQRLPKGEDDIHDYAVDLFTKMGIGHKGWDNGLLLTVAVKDRKYDLTVGYGLENVIPDGAKKKVVTKAVTKQLKAGQYDLAIRQMTANLGTYLVQRKESILTPTQMAAKQAANKRRKQIIWTIVLIVLGLLACWGIYAWVQYARKQRVWRQFARDRVTAADFVETYPLATAVSAAGIQKELELLDHLNSAPKQNTDDQVMLQVVYPVLTKELTTILQTNSVSLTYPISDYTLVLTQPDKATLFAVRTLDDLLDLLTPFAQDYAATETLYHQVWQQYCQENVVNADRQEHLWRFIQGHANYNEAVTAEQVKRMIRQVDKVMDDHGKVTITEGSQGSDWPTWWVVYSVASSQSNSSSSGSDDSFGGGFGGGSTGGGGFSGGW